jgi:hypothetical protein
VNALSYDNVNDKINENETSEPTLFPSVNRTGLKSLCCVTSTFSFATLTRGRRFDGMRNESNTLRSAALSAGDSTTKEFS